MERGTSEELMEEKRDCSPDLSSFQSECGRQ